MVVGNLDIIDANLPSLLFWLRGEQTNKLQLAILHRNHESFDNCYSGRSDTDDRTGRTTAKFFLPTWHR